MAVCRCRRTWSACTTHTATLILFSNLVAASGQGQLTGVDKGMIGLGLGVGVLLLAVAGYCVWRQRQPKTVGSNSFKLRSQLVADSVAVAKKRNSKLSESSVAAALADVKNGLRSNLKAVTIHSDCGDTGNGNVPAAERVPVVTFGLSEEDQTRLRATHVNDSVVLIRNKRETNTKGPEENHLATAYYNQQLAQFGVVNGTAQVLPGMTDGSSLDGGSSSRRVQFAAEQVVAQESLLNTCKSAAGRHSVEEAAANNTPRMSSAASSSSGKSKGDDTVRVEGERVQYSKEQ